MPSAKFRPLIVLKSDKVAYSVICGGRAYVDWLPYKSHTLRRAKAFFSRGIPFSKLEKSEYSRLDQCTTIRTHYPRESRGPSYFREQFVSGKSIPPQEARPAGYLRGNHALAQTRFDLLISEVVGAARTLTS